MHCAWYRMRETGPSSVTRARRMASCATSTGSAGHATAGAEAKHELSFQLDHPVGGDQVYLSTPTPDRMLVQ